MSPTTKAAAEASKKAKQATPKKSMPRVRKTPAHKSFRLSKGVRNTRPPLPGALRLWGRTFGLIRTNKRIFLGIIAVHVILSVIFVRGFGLSNDFVDVKQEVDEVLGSSVSQVGSSLALFGHLASTAGSQAGDVGGAYRVFLSIIASLAIIWGARQILAGKKTTVRAAFYEGMYPLIPFILVLLVIGLQMLPALLGNLVYGLVVQGGVVVTVAEKLIVLTMFLLFVLLSLYMVTSSIFALYIATLPDMTPMKALRSARGLVMHRRFSVSLRLVALPLVLLVLALFIIMPLIIFAPVLAEPVFFLTSSLCLLLANLYLYNLYRELL